MFSNIIWRALKVPVKITFIATSSFSPAEKVVDRIHTFVTCAGCDEYCGC